MATDKPTLSTRERVTAGLARRRRKETSFRVFGFLATLVGVAFLCVFFWSLVSEGASAFRQTFITLDVHFDEELLVSQGEIDFAYADFDGLVRNSLREIFPDVSARRDRRELSRLISTGAGY